MDDATIELSRSQRRTIGLLAGLLLLAAAVTIAWALPWTSAVRFWAVDFTVYYAAASALVNGQNPYVLADLSAHAPPKATGGVLLYSYPPLLAQMFTPLTALSLEDASRLWLAFNLVAIALSIFLTLRACEWSPRPAVLGLLLFGAFLFFPSLFTYLLGQASVFSLLMVSLGLWLFRRERPIPGGLAWGLAWVKPHVVGFLPYSLLLERRWRALAAFAVPLLVSLALAAPLLPAWIDAGLTSFGGNTRTQGYDFPYQATPLAPLDFLGTAGWVVRVALMLAGAAALYWLARRDVGWKAFTIAQLTLGLTLTPYMGRTDVALNMVPMLLILSDWDKARGPAWLVIAAWLAPLPGVLLEALADFGWLLLPLIWGSAMQWLMTGAAAWTVWLALKSGPATQPAAQQ